MKTIKQLQEQALGEIKGIAPPPAVRNLKFFARQVSGAVQPDMPVFLRRLEDELNKYALTLGSLDFDAGFGTEGIEDFYVMAFPDGEIVKNIYLTIEYKETGPEIYQYSKDVLKYSVKLKVNEVAPDEFDSLTTDTEVGIDDASAGEDVFGDDDADYMGEEAEDDLEEEIEHSKVPVGQRPKGRGWSLHRAGAQTGKDHDVYRRKTKRVDTVKKESVEEVTEGKKWKIVAKSPKESSDSVSYRTFDNNMSAAAIRKSFTDSGWAVKSVTPIKEEVESLEEALRVKSVGREIQFIDGDEYISFKVGASGNITIKTVNVNGKEAVAVIQPNKAAEFITKLTDHLIQFTK